MSGGTQNTSHRKEKRMEIDGYGVAIPAFSPILGTYPLVTTHQNKEEAIRSAIEINKYLGLGQSVPFENIEKRTECSWR